MLPLVFINDLFGRTRSAALHLSSHSGSCQTFIPEWWCWLLGTDHRKNCWCWGCLVVMMITPRFIGTHSWQRGGQSSNPLRFVPGQGCGLKYSSADQSTLLVCTMLSARGWMSPLLPPGMIKVSISFKNNIVNEFAGTCYSGFLFSPRRQITSEFMEQDVECVWHLCAFEIPLWF